MARYINFSKCWNSQTSASAGILKFQQTGNSNFRKSWATQISANDEIQIAAKIKKFKYQFSVKLESQDLTKNSKYQFEEKIKYQIDSKGIKTLPNIE